MFYEKDFFVFFEAPPDFMKKESFYVNFAKYLTTSFFAEYFHLITSGVFRQSKNNKILAISSSSGIEF